MIANPPYMGSKNMGPWLSGWVKGNYPDEKGDLCTCFIKRGLGMVNRDGYSAMITASSWMFISSFEKLRHHVIDNATILAMTQLSTHGFPNVTVPTCMWVMCGERMQVKGTYIRLEDFDRPQWQQPRTLEAVSNPDCPWRYEADAESFKAIPGWSIAYWLSKEALHAFSSQAIGDVFVSGGRTKTHDNALYLRKWWEISIKKFNNRWMPYCNGGGYRKWSGLITDVVDWSKAAVDSYQSHGGLPSSNGLSHSGICWGLITSSDNSFRVKPSGYPYSSGSPSIFNKNREEMLVALASLNSSVSTKLMQAINPTLNATVGAVSSLPFPRIESATHVQETVERNVSLSRTDWDAFETSWDFESHPLAQSGEPLIERQLERWSRECQSRFDELKANEEELNRIFARIYHMEGEVPIEVPDDKVSVRRADLARDVRSLVSYGVGCIFGRYSLDRPGLVLADQGSTVADYLAKVPDPRLVPDADNILPITDATWFEDDIVDSFYRFLVAAYGEDSLGDNVAFIEGALGCDLRTYFSGHFYADHLRVYQKRPIYWLFQSPRKSFSCLVYMHRYDESTVGEILTGYLRPLQGKLRSRIELLEKSKSARDAREANRLRAQVQELADWERDVIYPLAHERVSIDLDDGVKVNYNKFPHALAKVPGLSNWK